MKYRFKGKAISLLTKKSRLPNGEIINLEMIVHPGAALIVPFLNKDKIIFIRQFRPSLGIYLYELPAGTNEKSESSLSCAQREIVEETGYHAGKITRLGKIYPVPGYSNEVITIFKAEKLSKGKRATEFDEVIEVRPLSRLQIRKLFRQGKITDAKSISALAFCRIL